jgi:hypothetical protein
MPAESKTSSEPSPQIDVTPQMVEAGVGVLYWAEGKASKEEKATEVFRAMMADSKYWHLLECSSQSKGDSMDSRLKCND